MIDRSPNFLLIGAARCASTSLALVLDRHPEISVSSPKEPHFLAMEGLGRGISGEGIGSFAPENLLTRAQWLACFGDGEKPCLVDASASTMSYPDRAVANIREHCAVGVKLIVMLRNPVERAFSTYQYCLSKGWDAGEFGEFLDKEPQRMADNWQHLWLPRYVSRYEERLQPFIDAFGRENIHVVITEEFAEDPQSVLDDLFAFMGLERMVVEKVERHNPSGVPRSALIRSLQTGIRSQPFLLRALKALIPATLRNRIKQGSVEKAEMPAHLRERLTGEFRDTREWVERLIGRSLPSWG